MWPGVLLPDPVRNLSLVGWMDLPTPYPVGKAVEERERQPDYTARPKTMAVIKVGFSRILWENSALLPVWTQPMIVTSRNIKVNTQIQEKRNFSRSGGSGAGRITEWK